MKKVVLWIGIVASVVLTFDFGVGLLARQIIDRSGFRLARLYSRTPIDANVVIFGNSRAVNAFDADAMSASTGLRWMNLGYNGLGPKLVEAVACDYLDRNRKPDLVVLEVSNLWQGIGQMRDLRMFSAYSKRLAEIDADDSRLSSFAKHSSLYLCNGELLFRLANYIGKSDQKWVNSGTLRPENADMAVAKASKGLEAAVPQENVEACRRLIQELERRQIAYCLIVTPYLADEDGLRLLRAAVARLGSDKVVDHAAAIRDVSCYADPLHLNARGRGMYREGVEASVRRFLGVRTR